MYILYVHTVCTVYVPWKYTLGYTKDVVVIDVYLLAGSSDMRWLFLIDQIKITVRRRLAKVQWRYTPGVFISNLNL